MGRFITADSIVQSPEGNPQTFNRYSYCGNNPVVRVDPDGHFWKKLVGGIIGGIVGVISGQPWIGFSAYNAFTAAMEGGNIGAAVGGALIGYFGGGIIGEAFGNFWGTLAGGSMGGAAGAGIAGGDAGLAALAGLGGSLTGYGVGAMTGFAGLGTIVGGGVSSEIAGGNFGDGALGGLSYNIGFTIGSTFASMPSTKEVSSLQEEGDSLFYSGERIWEWYDPMNLMQAILSPGPFNHTNIGLGNGEVAGSHPASGKYSDGTDVRKMDDFDPFKSEKVVRIKGSKSVGTAARSLAVDSKGKGFNYLSKQNIFSSGDKMFCSQFTSQAYKNAGREGVYGIGPNTQYWYLKR